MELITPMFADATNAFWGQWMIVGLGIIGGLGGLAAIASYFATRRDFEALDKRVTEMADAMEKRITKVDETYEKRITKVEEDVSRITNKITSTHIELIANGEKRSTSIHRRLDPLIENTAAMKGGQEAFTTAFENFTRMMESKSMGGKQ